jgi:hypothetical protein
MESIGLRVEILPRENCFPSLEILPAILPNEFIDPVHHSNHHRPY